MQTSKHQWAVFSKGRIKIKACASCGEMSLPSNLEDNCGHNNVLESQIVKAGYRISEEHMAVG